MSPILAGALPDSSLDPKENVVRASLDKMPKGLESFIKNMFASRRIIPTLTMAKILDLLFDDQPWHDFEYETIVESLTKAGLVVPSILQMNQLQIISALRHNQSFIDKEWNLFEKAVLAMNGIPVLFFDKQNIPIEYIYHAYTIMRTLGPVELSEEVKHYIGTETLNDELLWHPNEFIDGCVKLTLDTIGKDSLGLDMAEMETLRQNVSKRFNSIKVLPIENIVFDESSAVDVMCSRIIRSLSIGRDLALAEKQHLSNFDSLKTGSAAAEGISDDLQAPEATVLEDLTMDPATELISNASSTEDNEELKVALASLLEGATVYNKDTQVAEAIEKQASFRKQASASIPIMTGTPLFGMEDTRQDPDRDLEKSIKIEGTASEIMREVAGKDKVSESEDDEDSEDAGNGFNIFNN